MLPLLRYVFRTYYHSNYLSYHLRRIIEKINIRVAVGFQLASTMFVVAIFAPQINLISSKVSTDQQTKKTLLAQSTQTKTTFYWPLNNFQISQGFHPYHPAIDLTTDYNREVLSIADGIVELITNSNWGYGKYIIIKHDNGYFSLYAHLSEILVGRKTHVSQGRVIGKVGKSGWATGPHLHLEIRGPEGTINPLEVLPKLISKTLI